MLGRFVLIQKERNKICYALIFPHLEAMSRVLPLP